jgi:hypothetical protein
LRVECFNGSRASSTIVANISLDAMKHIQEFEVSSYS